MSVSCRHTKIGFGDKVCPDCGKPLAQAIDDQCKEIVNAIIQPIIEEQLASTHAQASSEEKE